MAVEDHPLFSEWSGAWDAVKTARQHYGAAKELGNARQLRKARVSLARCLAVIMHAMLRDGTLFEA